MVQTSYIDILPEVEDAFFTGIQSSDRFLYSRLVKKTILYSRKKKKGVTARSLLPQISALWAGFSDYEKEQWSDAADVEKGVFDPSGLSVDNAYFGIAYFGNALFGRNVSEFNLNGWRLFVQDQSARIKNDILGVATPSMFHQSWFGALLVEDPATELKIIQIHPHFYWTSQKVAHKKGMYQPVLVTEDLFLPFTASLNYRAELECLGIGPFFGSANFGFCYFGDDDSEFAKFYVRFWYSYQGVDRYEELTIPFEYVCDWQAVSATLSSLTSYVIRYDCYFHIKGLQGVVYFDNVKLEHSGQNWARDPFCLDINQGFTRAFYQIPKHWAAVVLPEGADINSMYLDF